MKRIIEIHVIADESISCTTDSNTGGCDESFSLNSLMNSIFINGETKMLFCEILLWKACNKYHILYCASISAQNLSRIYYSKHPTHYFWSNEHFPLCPQCYKRFPMAPPTKQETYPYTTWRIHMSCITSSGSHTSWWHQEQMTIWEIFLDRALYIHQYTSDKFGKNS